MDNPGEYLGPAEGWAFIPFIGVLAAFAVAILAILFWMAGPGLRAKATLTTLVALVLGVSSTLGLLTAATSFEQRDAVAFAKYSTVVKTWAAHTYGVTLTADDVEDLVAGRPVNLSVAGIPRDVLLQPINGGTSVQLVGVHGSPLVDRTAA